MKYLFKFEEILIKTEKALIVFFIMAMIALSFLQVILRLFFHSGIVWMDPFLRHMVLWSGFLGAAVAAGYSKHFALDISHKIIPQKAKKFFAVAIDVFTVFISFLLFYAAFKFIKDEAAAESTAFYITKFGIKSYIAEIIVPVTFFLIGFHYLLNIFRKEARPL